MKYEYILGSFKAILIPMRYHKRNFPFKICQISCFILQIIIFRYLDRKFISSLREMMLQQQFPMTFGGDQYKSTERADNAFCHCVLVN